MARLVVKDNITSGGALAVGQTLRLGGFIMAAPSAVAPTMASQVIAHNLRVSSELAEQMDPVELSSLNELLDRIAALGVATNYVWIGLKPDQRDITAGHPRDSDSGGTTYGSPLDFEDELCPDHRTP